MNPRDYDDPDFTAYALGELSAEEAAQVRQKAAQTPESRAELDRIQMMISALQQGPALPVRSLNPRQRDTVLSMGQEPGSARSKVVPFRPPVSRLQHAKTMPSTSWRLAKYAAAAALTVGAFVLGQKSAGTVGDSLLAGTSAGIGDPLIETPKIVPIVEAKASSNATAVEIVPVPVKVTPAEPRVQVAAASQVSDSPPAIVASASVVERREAPTPAPAAPAAPTSVPTLKGFAQTSSATESRISVTPKLLRPAPMPREFAGVVLSSPMSPNIKPEAPRKPEPQPALVIHSWKAEIASCPWDPSRRLMRFVAQLPVEQNGIQYHEEDYKLVAKFDPFQVQAFRLVAEKHMAPNAGATQATRFAWYEIVPNRNFNASSDKPVTLGTIHVEQPRGAQPPPDSSPLKIVDRGTGWGDAREDFVFETAMIGWSLLLQGTENTGGLNYKLVLDLAEKTKGEDPKGERAKFISVVKQAHRTVGL